MRDKLNIVKSLKIFAISALWLSFASLNAIASTNTLSAVEIKNSENGYQIILKADKAAEVRKTAESQDDVTLEVKGILPIEAVGTVYNNVPEVDSVIIQPDSENTKIIIHGKNISSANILFAPIEVQTTATTSVQGEGALPSGVNEIELSKPIQAYAPVFNQSQDFEDQAPSGMFKTAVSMSLNKAHQYKPFAVRVFKYLKNLDKKFLAFGSIFFLIIMFGLKNIKADKNNDIKVGLTQSLKEKEIDMKDELSLSNDFQTARTQKSLNGKSVPSINYGIKAYQNSQKNPYTSQISGLPMKNVVKPQVRQTTQQGLQQRKSIPNQNQVQLQSRLNQAHSQMQAKRPVSAPVGLNKVAPSAPSLAAANGKSIDSIKFLESMTKIYERSGRTDLANELKSNIQKVQMAR